MCKLMNIIRYLKFRMHTLSDQSYSSSEAPVGGNLPHKTRRGSASTCYHTVQVAIGLLYFDPIIIVFAFIMQFV